MLKPISTASMAAGTLALMMVMVLAPTAHGAAQSAPPGPATASQAPTPLDRYLEHLRTLRVTFLQTVADAQGAEVGRSSGTLIVDRPGKFRWEIHPQAAAQATGGQVMVSDGRNLWYYDRDLEQVTVR